MKVVTRFASLFFLIALAFLPFDGFAATKTWLGGSGNWNDGTKWTPAGAPTDQDDAEIPTGTVTINVDSMVNGLVLSGGSIAGTETLTVIASCQWSGGTLSGDGSLVIQNGATLTIDGPSQKSINTGWTLENNGDATFGGIGNLTGIDGSQIVNNGVFDLQADRFIDYQNIGARPVFDNRGTLRKSAGDTFATMDFEFHNSGAVDIQSGELRVIANSSFTDGASFTGAGVTRLAGGSATYTLTGNISGSSLEFALGLIAGSGTLTGGMTWTGGTMTGSHSLTIAMGATLTTSGNTAKNLTSGFTLNNNGTISFGGTGDLDSNSAPVINNAGLIDLTTDDLWDYTNIGGRPQVNNTGTIRKSAGAGAMTVEFAVNNQSPGRVEVTSGTLNLAGGGTSDGVFHSESPCTLNFSADTHILNMGANFTGSGFSRLTGGSLQLGGAATVTGNFEISNVGGTITGASTLTVDGHLLWTGRGMSGGGQITIAGGATAEISGADAKFLTNGSTVRNEGTLTWTGGEIDANNASAVVNTGTWNIQTDANFDFTNIGGLPTLTNSGTIRKTVATGDTVVEYSFLNSGTVDIQTGTFTLPFNVDFQTGSNITGSGRVRSISNTLTISGTVTGDSLELATGALTGGGGTIDGTLHWTGGAMTGGVLNIGSNGTLRIDGSNAKNLTSGFTLNNQGTIEWVDGEIDSNAGALIDNDGLLDIQGNHFGDYTNTGNLPAIDNSGTVRKSAGSGQSLIEFAINNTSPGVVESLSGDLRFAVGGSSNGRFEAASGATVSHISQTQVITSGARFTGAGTHLILSNGKLDIDGPATVEGTLELASGGTIQGDDILTVAGVMNWTGGTMSGRSAMATGSVLIDACASLHISGSAAKTITLGWLLDNDGGATWNGLGDIRASSGPRIENSGVFEISNDRLLDYTNTGDIPVFENTGTIRKMTATGTTTCEFRYFTSGLHDIQTGTFRLFHTSDINDGAVFNGAGRTALNSTQTFTLTGLIGGTSLEFAAGALVGNGTITGALDWSGGTFSGANSLTIGPLGQLNLIGTSARNMTGGFTLNNQGTMNFIGGGSLRGSSGGSINNSGTIDLQTDSFFDYTNNGLSPTIENTGAIRKSAGNGISTIDFDFNNKTGGSVVSQTGQIRFDRSFTQTDGTVELAGGTVRGVQTMQFQGGSLTGAGTLTGNVNNTGATVAPGSSAGALTISGDYTQDAGGTLAIEIGGTAQGTQFDHLNVTGTATIGGTLQLSRINAFETSPNDTFEFLTASSVSGTFNPVRGTDAANGNFFDAQYNPANVTLAIKDGTPSISNTSFTHNAGQFGFQITGIADQTYKVEATQDFVTWTEIETRTLSISTWDFVDPNPMGLTYRIYRIGFIPQ